MNKQTTGDKDEPNIVLWDLLRTTGGKDEPNIVFYAEIVTISLYHCYTLALWEWKYLVEFKMLKDIYSQYKHFKLI
jgi:hypothetical protein